jgi:UDP-2-acetamido-3-amino-2,3-dideoxy-glucuronate N-acetyltransferase
MIHPTSDVQSKNIGAGTTVWQYAVVLEGAVIGENCNINCHTFVEGNVTIGNKVTIKSGVYLWSGMQIEDNVFVGPNATFTNDKYPRSKQYPAAFEKTILREGCSIGANATILGGITIGMYAIVGAGSVVTRDVPDFALVVGNPARIAGWLDKQGNKLQQTDSNTFQNASGNRFVVKENKLTRL